MGKSLIKHKWLILLVGISLLSHWYLFFDKNLLVSGDWVYYYNSQFSTIKDYVLYLGPYNLGSIMPVPGNWIFYIAYYLLSFLRINWDIGTRILFLLPIFVLTPIFGYQFFRKIFNDDVTAFFSTCIYSFNTFFLKLQLDWITYAFIWWILPALFLSITNYLSSGRKKYLAYTTLLIFLSVVYEVRIAILLLGYFTLFLTVYTLSNMQSFKRKLRDASTIILSFFAGLLLHSYWIIPFKFGKIAGDVIKYAAPNPFASFFSILDVLTLHSYQWSHNLVLEPFIQQPIEPRLFLIPIIAIIGVLVYKRWMQNKVPTFYFSFFILSFLLFTFLGKQEFPPFGQFYSWAFYHIPLFNLYRESSKFLIFVALSLSFFFGIGLTFLLLWIKKFSTKLAIILVSLMLLSTSLFNLQNFFTQKIGGMTKGVIIPKEYNALEQKLSNDDTYYRVLWLPVRHRFGYFSNTHPFVNMTDLVDKSKDMLGFELFDGQFPVWDQLTTLLHKNYANQLINVFSVKYIIIPSAELREEKVNIDSSQEVQEIFEHYGEREFFVSNLDSLNYLKKIDIGAPGLAIYENKNFKPYITSLDAVYNFSSFNKLENKYNFITEQLKSEYNFTFLPNQGNNPLIHLSDLFESIDRPNISKDSIRVSAPFTGRSLLFTNVVKKKLFGDSSLNSYSLNNQNSKFSDSAPESVSISYEKEQGILNKSDGFLLSDTHSSFMNLVKNPSLESSLWKDKVGDCNRYDDNGSLGMRLNQTDKSDGKASLQLEALRHTACTGPDAISIKGDTDYLLDFDYQSPNGKEAGYYVGFNDPTKTAVGKKLPIPGKGWTHFNQIVHAPKGATSLNLAVYSYSTDGTMNMITRYDNFSLIELPDLNDRYYLVSDTGIKLQKPQKVEFNSISPTKKRVHILSASTPFYLSMSEAYHPSWQLMMDNSKIQGSINRWSPFVHPDRIADENHFKLNNFLNVWYVDIDKLCKTRNLCTPNPDGTYNLDMVIEFWPQRWLYVGSLVSVIILVGCIAYFIFQIRKRY